jgi:hypothetical protein
VIEAASSTRFTSEGETCLFKVAAVCEALIAVGIGRRILPFHRRTGNDEQSGQDQELHDSTHEYLLGVPDRKNEAGLLLSSDHQPAAWIGAAKGRRRDTAPPCRNRMQEDQTGHAEHYPRSQTWSNILEHSLPGRFTKERK